MDDGITANNSEISLRGYVEFDETKFKILDDKSLQRLLAGAKMTITANILNIGNSQYSGVVEFRGNSISDALTEYLKSSQQIDSDFKISSLKKGNKWVAGGIMVQKFPSISQEMQDSESWDKISAFMNTLTEDEILLNGVSSDTLLYRLFHEDNPTVGENKKILHKCRCSREKMNATLDSIPKFERENLKIDGFIAIKCQFCGKEEKF